MDIKIISKNKEISKESDLYILITPVKNEENHLPKVAEAVIGQTMLPFLWVIVDDGSTDSTSEIISCLENRFDWIKSISLPLHPRDITFHYSYVCKMGFDYAIQFCNTKATKYNYIGLIDADTVVEGTYFEKIIQEFTEDESLGIASGYIVDMPVEEVEVSWSDVRKERPNNMMPRGSGRLWRKECFFETGGYPIEPSPDSISNIKASLRGWRIAQFGSVVALQQRETSSAGGLWNGYIANGKIAYYLKKHPLLVLMNTMYFLKQHPHYIGIAYIYGYFGSIILREKKTADPEISRYFWNDRPREVLNAILKKYGIR